MATTSPATERPPAWTVLEQAINQRRTVRAVYHGHDRLLSPHALGWKHGRAKLLAYQTYPTTTQDPPANPHQQWRSMFIDELQTPTITNDPWQTADNYTPHTTGIDTIALAIT
jgi:hypothetical protein